jgi:ABC-type nitrate/sulfonate/bicarbonate transport system permease component
MTAAPENETSALAVPARHRQIGFAWMTPGVMSLALLVVLLGMWELGGRAGFINAFFLSWPSAIATAGWRILANGELAANLWVTAYAYAAGVIAGCLLGTALGLAMGWWRTFGEVIDPFVVFFSAMPRIALYPVLLMIFGIGDMSRIMIVFIGVVFPVLFNAYVGAKRTPTVLVDVARVFGYSHRHIFRVIVLPASLPYLMAGYRIGITLGMILVVVAEFFGGSSGLGQKIALTAQLYHTPEMYAWVIYTSLVAFATVLLMDRVEHRVLRWI